MTSPIDKAINTLQIAKRDINNWFPPDAVDAKQAAIAPIDEALQSLRAVKDTHVPEEWREAVRDLARCVQDHLYLQRLKHNEPLMYNSTLDKHASVIAAAQKEG